MFGSVLSRANIVNILIVTLNLTILDTTREDIKYGSKSKRVAFVTVSHIFANLGVKYCNWESVSGLQMGKRREH